MLSFFFSFFLEKQMNLLMSDLAQEMLKSQQAPSLIQ
jgi:hypothetical protein